MRWCLRNCICSTAWRFHAIDATLSPLQRLLDGVEVHEGFSNSSQDNLTHWLISIRASAAGSRLFFVDTHARRRHAPAEENSTNARVS